MKQGHILQPTKRKKETIFKKGLPKCPLCGGAAFVMHDVVDGFEFGWSIGCGRAKIGDKYHNLNDYESFKEARIVFHCLNSKEQAIKAWEKRCKE